MREIKVERKGPRHSSLGRDPFTLAFVYYPGGEVMLSGYYTEIKEKIEEEYPIAIYKLTFWKNGKSRGHYRNTIRGLLIQHTYHKRTDKKRKYIFINPWKEQRLILTRIPKKWIPEYNIFLEGLGF